MKNVTLILDDGSRFHGKSFGYEKPVAGEVVFNTAMTGYPESLTDPSYAGQLMTLTYPLVGNYGVPPFSIEPNGLATFMESERIHAEAIIVSDYSQEYSHWNAVESLADWLKREQVPGITGIDTRELTKVLREHGVMMGRIVFDDEPESAPEAVYSGVNSDTFCLSTKKINRVAFVGNLEPTKGLFELIQAVLKIDYDIKLFIVGPGASNVIDKIKILAGVDLGHKIILMGGMANEDVINFMKTIDILVLPTYYKAEAFPISILEAMSLGKIVISTERAAIKDMLTGKNGNNCGLFVKEKSVDDIVDKIKYCIENHNEAELLMKNAYNKVWESYRKEVVYDIYRFHYSSLIQ